MPMYIKPRWLQKTCNFEAPILESNPNHGLLDIIHQIIFFYKIEVYVLFHSANMP